MGLFSQAEQAKIAAEVLRDNLTLYPLFSEPDAGGNSTMTLFGRMDVGKGTLQKMLLAIGLEDFEQQSQDRHEGFFLGDVRHGSLQIQFHGDETFRALAKAGVKVPGYSVSRGNSFNYSGYTIT